MSATDLQIMNLQREMERTRYVLIEILDELKKLNESEDDGD